MGKYDRVMDTLARLPREQTDYQSRIDLKKAEIEEKTAAALARRYTMLRASKEQIEESLSPINLELEALVQLMEDSYEAEGLRKLDMADGGSVALQPEPYASIADKEAYRQWCVSEGMEHAMHLWPSATQSLVKERLLAGHDAPPGVEVFFKNKAVWRK